FLVESAGNLPPRMRRDVRSFLDANLGDVAQQAKARALEALDLQAELEARTLKPLAAWFRDQPA
ncbi:MAG TPA: hypothetical protein VHH36_04655, partial [Candidatus Thermoplasmatota archaeon]|nr:hypothetical protein [Candidatus Thermoplasmatota archaeon]